MHRNSDPTTNVLDFPSRSRATSTPSPKPLVEIKSFGSNPGSLRGYVHVPVNLRPDAPLVVVLHGCSQTAAGYNTASGWSQLAEDFGFVLLFPEQRLTNNLGLCFNWFEPENTTRDTGEVHSIRQMIAAVQSIRAIDQSRIFITGFSGGGAMTAAMLATYPEVFAGGAIIAGVPYGVTSGMVDAFSKMQGNSLPGAAELAAKVRQASDNTGPWPRISIWHGARDHTVNVVNAAAIASQWCTVNGLAEEPGFTETVDGVAHREWSDANGCVLVEDYIVPAMGHGVPLDLSSPVPYGAVASYMLDVGISSTFRIAQYWDLERTPASETTTAPGSAKQAEGRSSNVPVQLPEARKKQRSVIARLVAEALRAVGLSN